jgi:Domain of unknown function (DUF4252)
MRRNIILSLSIILLAAATMAQTKTTMALQEKYKPVTLVFYKNTLKMWNLTDSKELDDLVKNIQKMRFLLINKSSKDFTASYASLKNDYQKEDYESIMTSRFRGRNFDVFFKESKSSPGTVVLVNDSTNLYVLDIIGTIDINKVGQFFSAMEKNTDIGQKIKEFSRHVKKDDDDKSDN